MSSIKRVAVVTGSNKGVGFAIVRALCKQFKGDVILTSRTEALGKAAVQALEKEGLNPKYHQLDICDHDSIVRLGDFLRTTYQGLDVLVNNAGIAYKVSSTAPFSEQAEVTSKTNFFGTLDACKVLFPLLRPHARVCNVSSMVCLYALPKCSKPLQERFTSDNITEDELVKLMTQFITAAKEGKIEGTGFPESAYGMSKVGVTVLTAIQQRQLDQQGVEDILVNCCCPGYVDTDMSSHKGHLTIDQGAETPVFVAMLPPNQDKPRGKFLQNCKVTEFKA